MLMRGRPKYIRVLHMLSVPYNPLRVRFFAYRVTRPQAPVPSTLLQISTPGSKGWSVDMGGGNEFQPHCCFSVDYFASQGAL